MADFHSCISIPGEVPAKKNSRINTRSGRSFPSKRYSEWHGKAVFLLRKAQMEGQMPVDVDYPVTVQLTFCHGDNRRRDSDNGVSSVLDAMVDAGVLSDDCWRIVRGITVLNIMNRGCPEVIVTVLPWTQ